MAADGERDRRLQQKKKRHPKIGLIARYWRVANPRRVRPRNARSLAASRNQGVRFGISERFGWRHSCEGGPTVRQIGSRKDPRSDPREFPREAQAVQEVRR